MQVQPVRRARTPRYPTSDVLRAHPEFLTIVPERWRANPMVLRVLGGVVGLALAAQPEARAQSAPASHVAPLFVHGDGRGSFGCVAINPPVFLSEDEARQVITEEAKKAGIEFAPKALTIASVDGPVTSSGLCIRPTKDGVEVAPPPTKMRRMELTVDGFDAKHKIAYEMVSTRHFGEWEDKANQCYSSVSSYDFREAATRLRQGLAAKNADVPWIGVFYEPLISQPIPQSNENGTMDWKGQRRKHEYDGKQASAEALRAQVRDFLAWLKAQGVI